MSEQTRARLEALAWFVGPTFLVGFFGYLGNPQNWNGVDSAREIVALAGPAFSAGFAAVLAFGRQSPSQIGDGNKKK
jgi:hypothetical protein